MIDITKYKLEFVNAGKEFTVPKMTVELHEKAMEEIAKLADTMPENKYNSYMTKYVIASVLNEADNSKTPEQYIKDINQMHPDDMVDLFNIVWNSGKKGKRINFRES